MFNFYICLCKWPSVKDVRSQERGSSLDADVHTYGMSARTKGEGFERVQTICGQGGGASIFRNLVRTSLWTASRRG